MVALPSTELESPCGNKALLLWAARHRYRVQGVQITTLVGRGWKISPSSQTGAYVWTFSGRF